MEENNNSTKCWCGRTKYKGFKQCVLHLNKHKLSTCVSDTPFIDFDLALSEYIQDSIATKQKTKTSFRTITSNENTLVITGIYFSFTLTQDILSVLNLFPSITFLRCTFFSNISELNNYVYYKNCRFVQTIHFFPMETSKESFFKCIFQNDVSISDHYDSQEYDTFPFFSNNIFKSSVFLRSNSHKLKGTFSIKTYINKLMISDCNITYPISAQIIQSIAIFNSTVYSVYSYHDKLQLFHLYNSTLKTALYFSRKELVQLSIINAELHSINILESKIFDSLILTKIIFEQFCVIIDSHIFPIIDLSTTTFRSGANFYNTQFNNENNRETFRIIKHSFDSIGNTIEANKYFALEMKAYEKELKDNGGHYLERVLLWVNRITSNYGQNWILPILWIFLFSYLVYDCKTFDPFPMIINDIVKTIIPFKQFIGNSHQTAKLLIYIAYTILIYQTIVALKRKTRR